MGAWGAGSFENDTAMDWAGGVQSAKDVAKPFERLKRETDAHGTDPELVVDSDFACELLAAAECVATMMGRRAKDVPDDVAERLAGLGEPDSLLFHQGRNAVLHVMRHSELAELWEEAAAESGVNEWLEEMTRLIDRLNPDVEHEPWSPEEIAEKVGAPIGPCGFCGEPVAKDEMYMMTIYDAANKRGYSRGFWMHLPCFNARVHHKFAVANVKFDPDNLPDLDQL